MDVCFVTPPGCTWQSLAMAWEDAVQSGVPLNEQYDPTALATKESNMRRWLVQVYGTLSLEAAQSVAKAKVRCQFSFFHRTRYHVDLVLKHWAWYLYSLTFPSNSFAETCCLIFWKNGCLLRHASWLYMAEFGYGLGRCRTRWCSFEWAIWSYSTGDQRKQHEKVVGPSVWHAITGGSSISCQGEITMSTFLLPQNQISRGLSP